LPARPLVSSRTLTIPSVFAGAEVFRQAHCATGRRQAGHMRPCPVEKTRPPLEDFRDFIEATRQTPGFQIPLRCSGRIEADAEVSTKTITPYTCAFLAAEQGVEI
jgi:hypothetical protein